MVFDQFSRNICRDTPAAFSQDLQALTLAEELVASRPDQNIEATQRAFAYLPYMHSESLCIHQQVAHLFSQRGMASTLAFEPGIGPSWSSLDATRIAMPFWGGRPREGTGFHRPAGFIVLEHSPARTGA